MPFHTMGLHHIELLMVLSFVSNSFSFTPPPMSTPPMSAPPSPWDAREMKNFFPNPVGLAAYCNNPDSIHSPYFCDPNKKISHANAATIASTLVAARNETEYCVNNSTRGLTIGVAVISRINVISEDEGPSMYMQPFNQYIRDKWGSMNSRCDAAVLLFVSCDDSLMYESVGPNTLNIIEPSCRPVFNSTSPVHTKRKGDCFSDLIQPKLTAYRQIVDRTHECYAPYQSSHTVAIVIGVLSAFSLLTIILFVACRCASKKSDASKRTREETALKA